MFYLKARFSKTKKDFFAKIAEIRRG